MPDRSEPSFHREAGFDGPPPLPHGYRMVESYRRGPVGWITGFLFWTWHVVSLLWVVVLWATPSSYPGESALNGVTFFISLVVWMFGTLFFGFLRHVTRGKKVITAEPVR